MCAPIAAILPWVAAAASIGGTALSVAGQVQSGRAAGRHRTRLAGTAIGTE